MDLDDLRSIGNQIEKYNVKREKKQGEVKKEKEG